MLQNFVIVGGGTAGWMSAVFLAHLLKGQDRTITLIESADIGTVGVGEATIPPIRFFNQMVGINEAEFMTACGATFKLGIEFDGWRQPGESYMHPFGEFGKPINGTSFHAYWLKYKKAGGKLGLWDFSLPYLSAKAGRFSFPVLDQQNPLSTSLYAYHFDAGLYAQFLRKLAETRGVKRIEATIKHVAQDSEDGTLTSLQLENGQIIEGDFFLDCTGLTALLIDKTLGVDYVDWSHFLPTNRALAVPTQSQTPPDPYTRAIAHNGGWQWHIPLQHRTGNGLVYSDQFLSDEAAHRLLLSNLSSPPLRDPFSIRFTTGRRQMSRHKNVLALGLSSGFLEPLESTSIHLIQHGLIKFAATFPRHKDDPLLSAHYNRIMADELEQIRDFLIFHYYTNERYGEPLWDYCRNMTIPGSLVEKIDLFKQHGLCIFPNQTIFQETNWLAVMIGQGITPQSYDPLADSAPSATIENGLKNAHEQLCALVSQMPSHKDTINSYCAISPLNMKGYYR